MMTTYSILTGPAHQMKSTTFEKRLCSTTSDGSKSFGKISSSSSLIVEALHAILFSVGLEWHAAYPLPTGSNKTLQLQPCALPGFCKGEGGCLKQKLECSCLKKVAIGQHVEHTGSIQG